MGLKLFEIFFDKPQKVYLPGETVSGRIKVIIDSPKKIRGLEFSCVGKAQTSWDKYESVRTAEGKDENRNVTYEGNEEYFNIKYYLVGGKGQELELPTGEHIYPFTCVLPPVLPPSFEDSKGYIRYIIKATLDRPWKFDQEAKAVFTVIGPLDLNLTPRLKEPVTMTLEKYFCCLWCKSGPLDVVVSLPFSGYVPGQTINITCDVDNASNVQIDKIVFKFKQKVHFHATHPSRETEKKETNIVVKSHVDAIPAKENGHFSEQIIVPSLPPSNLTNCSLIDLDYELEVEVDVSGFHTNISSSIPITIGTIPIQESVGYVPSAPAGHVAIDMNKSPSGAPDANIGWVPPPVPGNGPYNPQGGTAPPYPSAPGGPPVVPGGNPPPYPTSPQNTYPPPQYTKYEESQFHNPQQPDLGFKPLYPVFTFPNAPDS